MNIVLLSFVFFIVFVLTIVFILFITTTVVVPLAVDVVALNSAPLLLQFQVLQHGQLIVEHDRTQRCLFQMQRMSRYYDAKPYLDYVREQTIRRIQEKGLGHGYHGHRNALTEARRLRATLASVTTSGAN